jgi:predicted aminopeptidase
MDVDLIAIPDFSAGAMENWGLITYRLTSLLSNPSDSSTSNQQWVITVVAHELAHQVLFKDHDNPLNIQGAESARTENQMCQLSPSSRPPPPPKKKMHP